MPEGLVDLQWRARPWQQEALAGINSRRWSVLVCHRRAGKTLLIVIALITEAINKVCQGRPPARYAYIAPELSQAKDACWGYMRSYGEKIPGCKINEAELSLTLPNGNRIRLYGASDPDRLRGGYLDGVAIDEVAQMPSNLWDDVIQPQLTDYIGWAVFMGTPNGINLLSEKFEIAQQDPAEWFCAKYTVYQTNAIHASEVKRLEDPRHCDPVKFAREYLCDFSAAVSNALITYDQAMTATRRHYRPDEYQFSPIILGVDTAQQGEDRSAAVLRQGLFVDKPWVWTKLKNFELAAHIAVIIQQRTPDAVFVDVSGGYGTGVVERLLELGHKPIGVQFGGKSDGPEYVNKRSEMWGRMARWIREKGHIPNIPELIQDLCGPTYEIDGKDRECLESKDSMKKRGRKSPDLGDAMALCWAHDVPGKRHGDFGILGQAESRMGGKLISDYDPMDAMR